MAGIPASGKMLINQFILFTFLEILKMLINQCVLFALFCRVSRRPGFQRKPKFYPAFFFKNFNFLFKSEMATVQNQQITSNNETFTQGVYNGFKIIIRNSDGYINASDVVKQINNRENTTKQIKTLFKSVQYQDFENRLKTILPGKILKYNLINNVNNNLRGSYVHPKLINFVCFWCSPSYALLVSEIMDSINEQNTTEMNKRIKDLQDKNNELKTQIVQDIGDQRENSKYIFIDKVDESTFKIVYDQKKKNKQHYKTFEVLASANVAKNTELKKYYIDKHKRTFNLSNLDKVIKIISANQTH